MRNEKNSPDHKSKSERIGEIVGIRLRNSKWYVNFQHGGKQVRKSLKTGSKKKARRRALAIERDVLNGDFQRQARAPMLASVIDEYLSHLRSEGRAARTLTKYRHCFRLMQELAEKLHVQRLSGIDLRFIDAFKKMRVDRGAQLKTVGGDVVILRQLVNFALQRKMINRDPLSGLRLTKVKGAPQPFWVRADVERILAAAKPPYLAPLVFLAETGTRFGEMQHLTWTDVTLDGDWPQVRIQAKAGWKPKTGDVRSIPLNPRLVETLSGLPVGTKWVFTARCTNRHPESDRRISERRLLSYLKGILKPLGLRGHLHTFRHSFISHALVEGTAEAIVRNWVGHVDQATLQIYTHIADQASRDAMRRLSEPAGETETSRSVESSSNSAQSHEDRK